MATMAPDDRVRHLREHFLDERLRAGSRVGPMCLVCVTDRPVEDEEGCFVITCPSKAGDGSSDLKGDIVFKKEDKKKTADAARKLKTERDSEFKPFSTGMQYRHKSRFDAEAASAVQALQLTSEPKRARFSDTEQSAHRPPSTGPQTPAGNHTRFAELGTNPQNRPSSIGSTRQPAGGNSQTLVGTDQMRALDLAGYYEGDGSSDLKGDIVFKNEDTTKTADAARKLKTKRDSEFKPFSTGMQYRHKSRFDAEAASAVQALQLTSEPKRAHFSDTEQSAHRPPSTGPQTPAGNRTRFAELGTNSLNRRSSIGSTRQPAGGNSQTLVADYYYGIYRAAAPSDLADTPPMMSPGQLSTDMLLYTKNQADLEELDQERLARKAAREGLADIDAFAQKAQMADDVVRTFDTVQTAYDTPIPPLPVLIRKVGSEIFSKAEDGEYVTTPRRPSRLRFDPVKHHTIVFVCKKWRHRTVGKQVHRCVVRSARDVEFLEQEDKAMLELVAAACEYAYHAAQVAPAPSEMWHRFRDGSSSAFLPTGEEVVRVPPVHFPAWRHVMVRCALMRGQHEMQDVLPTLKSTQMGLDGTVYYTFSVGAERASASAAKVRVAKTSPELVVETTPSHSFLAGQAYLSVYDLAMSADRVPRLPYDGLGPLDVAPKQAARATTAWLSGRKVYLMSRTRGESRPMCLISTCGRDGCRMPFVCMGSLRVRQNVERVDADVERGLELFTDYRSFRLIAQTGLPPVYRVADFADPPHVYYMDTSGSVDVPDDVVDAVVQASLASKGLAAEGGASEEVAWGAPSVRSFPPKAMRRDEGTAVSRFTSPWVRRDDDKAPYEARMRDLYAEPDWRDERRRENADPPELRLAYADLGEEVRAAKQASADALFATTLRIAKKRKADVVVVHHVQISRSLMRVAEAFGCTPVRFRSNNAEDAPPSTLLLVFEGASKWRADSDSILIPPDTSTHAVHLESCVCHTKFKHKETKHTCTVLSAVQCSDLFRASLYEHLSAPYDADDVKNAKRAFHRSVLPGEEDVTRRRPFLIVATTDEEDDALLAQEEIEFGTYYYAEDDVGSYVQRMMDTVVARLRNKYETAEDDAGRDAARVRLGEIRQAMARVRVAENKADADDVDKLMKVVGTELPKLERLWKLKSPAKYQRPFCSKLSDLRLTAPRSSTSASTSSFERKTDQLFSMQLSTYASFAYCRVGRKMNCYTNAIGTDVPLFFATPSGFNLFFGQLPANWGLDDRLGQFTVAAHTPLTMTGTEFFHTYRGIDTQVAFFDLALVTSADETRKRMHNLRTAWYNPATTFNNTGAHPRDFRARPSGGTTSAPTTFKANAEKDKTKVRVFRGYRYRQTPQTPAGLIRPVSYGPTPRGTPAQARTPALARTPARSTIPTGYPTPAAADPSAADPSAADPASFVPPSAYDARLAAQPPPPPKGGFGTLYVDENNAEGKRAWDIATQSDMSAYAWKLSSVASVSVPLDCLTAWKHNEQLRDCLSGYDEWNEPFPCVDADPDSQRSQHERARLNSMSLFYRPDSVEFLADAENEEHVRVVTCRMMR